MKILDPETEEFERFAATRFRDHTPPDQYSDVLRRADEETDAEVFRLRKLLADDRRRREQLERTRAANDVGFVLKAGGLITFGAAVLIVPVVLTVYALTGAVIIVLKVALALVLLRLVGLVFSATFRAARAPFALVNLLSTAASGSASAWRFIRDLLR